LIDSPERWNPFFPAFLERFIDIKAPCSALIFSDPGVLKTGVMS